MDVLLLRFAAPLMSFGAPIVDRHGIIQPYPALSMITGLLGNALGYDHAEADRLRRLQERIRYASRQDRSGVQIRDYQTVDLSKDYMSDDLNWTTRGALEKRKGGTASSGTHIRLRDYWADAVHTVAVMLDPADEAPTLDDLEEALARPERPLFLGRKPCLPAEPLLAGRIHADDCREALRRFALHPNSDRRDRYRAWWPIEPKEPHYNDDSGAENMRRPVSDRRDWRNQIHTGERWIAEGEIVVDAEYNTG